MATIGIFDSGVGGLSIWKELYRALPGERYIYFSDNAYCPYGGKSDDTIVSRARFITDLLLEKGAELIVIACNTATAAAIATLRKEYSIKFIGTEPAVKTAAARSKSRVVGVLATESTLKASKYRAMKERVEGDARIVEKVGEGFVEIVESGSMDTPEALDTVRRSLQPLLDEGADEIVLGCTHYPFLKDLIGKIASGKAEVINPAPAIARQTIRVLSEEGIKTNAAPAQGRSGIELISSGPKEPLERMFETVCQDLYL